MADPIVQPIYGRVASDERRAGLLAVAAIAERLSRTAGSACLAFDVYLRDLCVELAAMSGRPGSPTLTCRAADVLLPLGPAITLGLIAEELVDNALAYGFPGGRGGRIVSGSPLARRSGGSRWRTVASSSEPGRADAETA